MNVIGDIAGQYDALQRLLAIMPDDEPVSLGDMIDRGPEPVKVLDFFKANGRIVQANHEHLMIEYFRNNEGYSKGGYYETNLWSEFNGGQVTLDQIQGKQDDYLEWLKSAPFYIIEDGYFISHAPKNPVLSLDQVCDLGTNAIHPRCDSSILWNRGSIRRMPGLFQIHGHNALKVPHYYKDSEGDFGVNIDTSRARVLTGFSTLQTKIYWVEY